MADYTFENCFFDSDLAVERRRADLSCGGIEYREERTVIGKWERIRITSEEGAKSIGRPKGHYDTLTLPRMDELDFGEIDDAKNELSIELCKLFDIDRIYPERILVAGLGNGSLTPDAVGPLAATNVEPTLHISEADEDMFDSLDCSEIAVIRPGVLGESGIDTGEIIMGVCQRIRPDVVIAIDSLASRSPDRLGTTIQISDTGILPGGGIGAKRKPIDEKALGIPVIAIGVPTVIDSRFFAKNDTRCGSMFVAPKEIDTIVRKAAEIIGGGINQAFGIYS